MDDVKFDDFSGNFQALRRELWESREPSYKDFLKSLKPDYRKVRRDIGFGYAMLLATIALAAFLPLLGVPKLLAAVLGALSIGYWIAYLQLFIHEGAHYNLAPERGDSDRFCDRYISWMVGTTVADYRTVHFQHHRSLGTTDDSEHTYFFPLNVLFVIKGLLGLRAIEVIFARKAIVDDTSQKKPAKTGGAKIPLAPLIALLIHGGFVVVAFLLGYWWLSLAWLAGVGMFFPFLGALRQLLEHRDEEADNAANYHNVPHGAVTRIFDDGPLASTFGGAGFNRHLLHHWEPQISYTNLPALEQFLMQTKAGAIIARRKSTYSGALLNLISIY
jgi:fatty acid desaturase